jgi:hypothetical protein
VRKENAGTNTTSDRPWPDEAELQSAELGGSSQLWEVSEAYSVENGVVVATGKRAHRSYAPLAHRELPGRLAEVSGETEAIEFCRRWGLLGYARLYLRQSGVAQKRARAFLSNMGWGDPLEWMYAHARTVRMLLELIRQRKDTSSAGLKSSIDSIVTEGSMFSYAQLHETDKSVGLFGLENPLDVAAHIVVSVINQNLVPIHRRYQAASSPAPGTVVRNDSYGTLLVAVYAHLADAMDGHAEYYQCGYRRCVRWWPREEEVRGPKRRYCPPDIPGAESRCSRKERSYN